MLSSGANVIKVSSGANVIIWCYHVLLSSGMIAHPFFIFPENFTHSLLSSAIYSAEWYCRVWLFAADRNVRLAPFFFKFVHHTTTQPLYSAVGSHTRPSKFKFKQKCTKQPLLSAVGFYTYTWLDGNQAAALWGHIMAYFSRAENPSEDRTGRFISDEYDRVNKCR